MEATERLLVQFGAESEWPGKWALVAVEGEQWELVGQWEPSTEAANAFEAAELLEVAVVPTYGEIEIPKDLPAAEVEVAVPLLTTTDAVFELARELCRPDISIRLFEPEAGPEAVLAMFDNADRGCSRCGFWSDRVPGMRVEAVLMLDGPLLVQDLPPNDACPQCFDGPVEGGDVMVERDLRLPISPLELEEIVSELESDLASAVSEGCSDAEAAWNEYEPEDEDEDEETA